MKQPMLIVGFMLMSIARSHATSLQVAPVTLDLTTPSAATTVTLRNMGDNPINAQVRVFRWQQANGGDQLNETHSVVISPPLTSIAQHSSQVVRVVRVSREPVQEEECYRLIVDEIPEIEPRHVNGVAFSLRYSIPVFVHQSGLERAQLAWRAEFRAHELVVEAVNLGRRHAKISNLRIIDPPLKQFTLRSGLNGYVLAGSATHWSFLISDASAIDLRHAAIAIAADSDEGPIRVVPAIAAR